MTSTEKNMEDSVPFKVKVNLAESGRIIMSEAKGDVRVEVKTHEGEKNLVIRDILYIPSLRTNLLSVSRLSDQGYKVIFHNGSAKIVSRNGETIAIALNNNGVFVLQSKIRSKTAMNIQEVRDTKVNISDSEKENLRDYNREPNDRLSKILWHRRLGHVCDKYLEYMKNRNIVRDLKFISRPMQLCEPCVMGKLVQKPHRLIENKYTKQPLELVHIDLCGPMPVESLNGSRYIFVIVDDFSRYASVYILKNESEAFECFVDYMNRSEKQLEKVLKNVRSDNGKEFVNENFIKLFRNKGIVHQRTVAYNPQSNGVAERMNRSLLEKIRAI